MSWGYKILLMYLGFIVMISYMVFVASKQTNEMQDENYYAKEIKYQDVIDGKNNLAKLKESVEINIDSAHLTMVLPLAASVNATGDVRFLRPSDEKKDIDTSLAINVNGEQQFSIQRFSKGLYHLQLAWISNHIKYYFEHKVYIE